MKANHNKAWVPTIFLNTVSKSKITKKWKPITTQPLIILDEAGLFQRAKLQKNESQSQQKRNKFYRRQNCFKEQNYKKMKANHNARYVRELNNLLFQRAKLQKNESQSQLQPRIIG